MKSTGKILLQALLCMTMIKPALSQVIITEIFADPTPTRGLPEREFIELYNAGFSSVNLKGYTLEAGSGNASFPETEIRPGEYVVVCRKTYEAEFYFAGKVIGLSTFSLLNNGAWLILRDSRGQEIHRIKYDLSWYEKGRDQGYSLEMIDYNYPCRAKDNWTSSKAEKGATPGGVNSVAASLPDTEGPVIVSHGYSGRQLTLMFNERLGLNRINDPENYTVAGAAVDLDSISVDAYGGQVRLYFNRMALSGEIFEIQIENIEDCSGNVMAGTHFSFGNFLPADSTDILISELLFDPLPGRYDFVEVYNNSGRKINIGGWKLGRKEKDGNVAFWYVLSGGTLLIEPGGFRVFTENKTALFPDAKDPDTIIEVSRLPVMPQSGACIILTDDSGRFFDEVCYSEDMHHPMLDKKKGVSLERVSFRRSSVDPDNWKSSSLFNNFSTPGYKNSQSSTILSSGNIFYADPEVFFPAATMDPERVALRFLLSEPGSMISVKVLDIHGRLVKDLVNNVISGVEGSIFWDGTNSAGMMCPVGYYLFYAAVTSGSASESCLVKTVLGAY